MRWLIAAALSVALLFGAQACGGTDSQCQALCDSSVSLNLVPPLTEPGTYEFELIADGWTTHCSVDSTDYGTNTIFQHGVAWSCDSTDAHLDASSTSPFAVNRVWFSTGTPRQVTLRITRDGTVVRERSFAPTYVVRELCGQQCASAELEL
jgi:hypothetical protein